MEWKRFDKETPTEEGWYLTAKYDCNCTVIGNIKDALWNYHKHNDTHWLLIQPPKGDKE